MDQTTPVFAILRHFLTAAGAWMASKGYVEVDMVDQLTGAMLVLASVGWYWYAKPKA